MKHVYDKTKKYQDKLIHRLNNLEVLILFGSKYAYNMDHEESWSPCFQTVYQNETVFQ